MNTLKRLSMIIAIFGSGWAGAAKAVVFEIAYDDTSSNNAIDTVVGTGALSYDGPATVGSFALNTLTGVSFTANVAGESFVTSDLANDPDSGIEVFDLGGGVRGMVFSGFGGMFDGSFDALNQNDTFLSHEPTSPGGVGCCGGDGVVNRYVLRSGRVLLGEGEYQAIARDVPEPGTLGLLGAGLIGLAWSWRRRKA